MPIRSSDETGLPWETGREFQVWRYGVGHSQLLLHSRGDEQNETINLLFEAVVFMRLRQNYPDAVLRLATDEELELFDELPPIKLLRLAISSGKGVGLVACSRLTARATTELEDTIGQSGTVVFHQIARTSGS